MVVVLVCYPTSVVTFPDEGIAGRDVMHSLALTGEQD